MELEYFGRQMLTVRWFGLCVYRLAYVILYSKSRNKLPPSIRYILQNNIIILIIQSMYKVSCQVSCMSLSLSQICKQNQNLLDIFILYFINNSSLITQFMSFYRIPLFFIPFVFTSLWQDFYTCPDCFTYIIRYSYLEVPYLPRKPITNNT